MTQVFEVQNKILMYLKNASSGATSRETSDALHLSQTTIQEHLGVLSSKGLVYHTDARGLIGRPKRKYFFSRSDFNQFTTQYSWLSTLLLEELAQSMSSEEIKKLLGRLAARVSSNLETELLGLSERERLQKLAGIMNDLGYQISFKNSDKESEVILEAKSCVYHKVAVRHPQLCHFDIQILENVSQKSVELQCCIARGAKVCRFSLVPRNTPLI